MARRNAALTAAPTVGDTSTAYAWAEDKTSGDYALIVFVIGIVVLSTTYFGAMLLLELYRSCVHYKLVIQAKQQERKRQKECKTGDGNDAEANEEANDIVQEELAAPTDQSVSSWCANPQVSPVEENTEKAADGESSSKQPDNNGSQSVSIDVVGTDRLSSLSSYKSSDVVGIERLGTTKTGAEKIKVKQRAARFGGKEKRKKHFNIEPSRVGHDRETKGTDDEQPSMVLRDDDGFHTNPDSALGNALRVLKKTASANLSVDTEQESAAAAPRSSSMHGFDSDLL